MKWAFLVVAVLASRGDELLQFKRCLLETRDAMCTTDGRDYRHGPLPLHLRLLQWTCNSDADYLCQQRVTQELLEDNKQIEQFHGKWPFVRIAGVQEPASVVFSILNGMIHYSGLKLIRRRVRHVMRPFYIVFAFVGMNAWLWSTVFHIRDFPSTEKLDYFSAGTYVLYGLFYAVVRVFKLYDFKQSRLVIALWGCACLAALLSHIYYLTFIRFDYGYNMLANVIVGALHGLIWVYHSFTNKGPAWTWWPALVVLALSGAMSLELFDFPPVMFAFDAHSLWHLSTIPITWVWYRFLLRDADHEVHNAKQRRS